MCQCEALDDAAAHGQSDQHGLFKSEKVEELTLDFRTLLHSPQISFSCTCRRYLSDRSSISIVSHWDLGRREKGTRSFSPPIDFEEVSKRFPGLKLIGRNQLPLTIKRL